MLYEWKIARFPMISLPLYFPNRISLKDSKWSRLREVRNMHEYLDDLWHSLIRMRMFLDMPGVQDHTVRHSDAFFVQAIQRQAIRSESFIWNLAT